jgi:DNA-binding transcriptional MerR regulator
MASALTIGQLARGAGISAKTIRYYEERGVLPRPRRSAAGYRQYTDESVARLVLVRRARALGLPLERLRELAVALAGERDGLRPRLRELIRAHLAEVERRLAELALLRQQLERTLRRLRTSPRGKRNGPCRCLETEGTR